MSFRISTAKIDITPPPGVNPFMGGYGVQSGPRMVVGDDPYAQLLHARCVVIWDDGHPFAIVSLDILGIPRAVNLAVRSRLLQLTDWDSSDIVLLATHTHTAPTVVVLVRGKVMSDGPDKQAKAFAPAPVGLRQLDQTGQWLVVPQGDQHHLVRLGTVDAQVVEIELR